MSTYTVRGFDVGSGPAMRAVVQVVVEGFAKGFKVYVQRELRGFVKELFERLGIRIEFREVDKMREPYVYLGLDGGRIIVIEHDAKMIVSHRVYDLKSLPDILAWVLLQMLGDEIGEDSKRKIFDAVRMIICAGQTSQVTEAEQGSQEAEAEEGGEVESSEVGDVAREAMKRLIEDVLGEGSAG